MSEMSGEAPLAQLTEDWGDFVDFQTSDSNTQDDEVNKNSSHQSTQCTQTGSRPGTADNGTVDNAFSDNNFMEGFMAGSLEDLVNSFDEKITNCFCDYDEEVESLAPVQVRSQEEVINDCQYVAFLVGFRVNLSSSSPTPLFC